MPGGHTPSMSPRLHRLQIKYLMTCSSWASRRASDLVRQDAALVEEAQHASPTAGTPPPEPGACAPCPRSARTAAPGRPREGVGP